MKDCTICEQDALMRVAELEIEVENLQEWKYTLEQALEVEHKLMTAYKEENEELQNKLRVYQAHCIKEKSEKPINLDDETEYKLPGEESILDDLEKLMEKNVKYREHN